MRRLSLAMLVTGHAMACGDPGAPARPGDEGVGAPWPPSPPVVTIAPSSPITRIAPPFDVVSTSGALDQWPRIVPGVEAHAITSYDRGGGNDDGFGRAYSELYENEGEHVIFDA